MSGSSHYALFVTSETPSLSVPQKSAKTAKKERAIRVYLDLRREQVAFDPLLRVPQERK
jgi:hypothetical protein